MITADVITKTIHEAPKGRYYDLEELTHLKGSDLVSEVCGRCSGEQRIHHYLHVHDGICFKCHGKRVTVKRVSSVRSRIRAAAKRAAEEIAKAEAAEARRKEYEAKIAAKRAEEKANATPVPTGRVEIVGEIVAFKLQDSVYGSTMKVMINGGTWKVWGTLPKALDEAEKGDVVKFTATVEAAKDDESFGFFKRPTKASIVAKAI